MEDVIVENIKEKIYKLYSQELSDLSIGYSFNENRIKQITDLIAQETCEQSYITELFE